MHIDIVVLPGFMGSALRAGRRRVWPSPAALRDPERLLESGLRTDGAVTLLYGAAIAAWRAMGFRVRVFDYDWRGSVVDAAGRFAEWVSEQPRPGSKRPFLAVAHSMGGLVLAESVRQDARVLDRIGKAALLGVPLRGTGVAARAILEGGWLPWAEPGRMSAVLARMPGLLDLLPAGEEPFYVANHYPETCRPSQQDLDAARERNLHPPDAALLGRSIALIGRQDTCCRLNLREGRLEPDWSPEPGDGTVALRSAVLDGLSGAWSVGASHQWLASDPKAILAVALFGLGKELRGRLPDLASR